METANWIALLSAALAVVMTIILFLVGRLLNANTQMVDALRDSLRDQSKQNQEAFRDLFGCIDVLRTKLGAVDIRVVRLEEARKAEEHRESAFGG